MSKYSFAAIAAAALSWTVPLVAQDSSNVTIAAEDVALELVDPSQLKMPSLDFTATSADEADYEKYFYFHRDQTSFAVAFADIKECDALASGIRFYLNAGPGSASAAMAQYGPLAGGLGSALGNAIADAIFGSAERRKIRRVNLRNCMNFKGYQRYPLNHALWDQFNFEEGMGRKREDVRENALALQALVASGPKPATRELGL